MNATNRVINRLILFVVGICLLFLGAAVVAIIIWPAAAKFWTGAATAVKSWTETGIALTALGATTVSWIGIAALLLIVVLLILLILVLTHIGGGRSRTVLRDSGRQSPLGHVIVQESFVSDALKHSLNNREEILFSSVNAKSIRSQPTLHLSVTPRQNTSPLKLLEDLNMLVTNLETLTGESLPTYISFHSGLRAKLASNQRHLT
jgi:hypothetical protein